MNWTECPVERGAAALATNQRRARGLRQVVARHLLATDDVMLAPGAPPRYHYTLQVRTDGAPLYSSEPQLSAGAVWEPLHLEPLPASCRNATQLLVRVFARAAGRQAEILSWAVTLAGLVPVSLRWQFQPNTLLFRFGAVWLTAAEAVAERRAEPPRPPLVVAVPEETVGAAADGPRLERLHRCQRERRRQEAVIEALTEEGGALWPAAERRRRAAAARDQLCRRLALLRADIAARTAAVREASQLLTAERARQAASAAQLSRQWDELREDSAALADWRVKFAALHALYLRAHSQLAFRRREMCTELQVIYPVRRTAEGCTIQGIHLPNAEEYSAAPDRSVSVALAHASHLVVMVAWVLGVGLRYAISQRDANPVVEDHIVVGLLSGERQFPLVAGRESLPFNYAVYLLNKNIAQLRQYCGLETADLRAMLPNLAALLADGVPEPDGELAAAGAEWPSGQLFWPCGPPPATRRSEQRLRLPAGSVTLHDAVTDDDAAAAWPPAAGPDRDAAGSLGSAASASDEGGRSTPAEPPPGEPTPNEPTPNELGSSANGVAEPTRDRSPETGPAAPPPPVSTASAVHCGSADDADWDYVTSRMQILTNTKSFKLISRREADET